MAIPNPLRLNGTVISPRSAQVSTELGGLVEAVLVDLGDRVEQGQPLAQLDATLASLELRRAEAETREARETLADAQREVNIGERLAADRNLPQNQLEARQAQARIAAAAVERLEAEEARLRERVRRHEIAAPFAGVVAVRIADEGEWVAPGMGVVQLVETARLFVDVPVPQRHFPELGEDPAITLAFDAMPGEEFEAAIVARVPVSDPTARTFTLRLEPRREAIPLTPGMSARVQLDLATGREGVVVPRDAVIRYPDGRTTVWVLQDQEGQEGDRATVTERQVTLATAFHGLIHVESGLEAGERVVIRGNEALAEGQAVRLVESPAPGEGQG